MAIGLLRGPATLDDLLPCVSPDRVLALGPRDAEELVERGVMRIDGIVEFRDGAWLAADMLDGVPALIARTAGSAPAGWWFHVDLDVLSSRALTAVDYPQPGGIGWERLDEFTKIALAVPGCRGASVVIYNPDLDAGAAAGRIVEYVSLIGGLLRSGTDDAA